MPGKKDSRGPMKRGKGWRGRDLIATASSNKGDSKNNLKEGEGTSSTVPMTMAVEELTSGAITTIKELWTAHTAAVELSRPLSPCEL